MAYERKDGDFVLFKNDRKTNPKAPDYKGTILINGEELELAAWKKEGKNGTFMAGSAKPKQERGNRRPLGPQTTNDPDW